MRAPELLALLQEIEASVPVQEWSIGEVQAWPLARAQIAWTAQSIAAESGGPAPSTLARATSVIAPLRAGRWSVHGMPLPSADVLMLGKDWPRSARGADGFHPHLDPIAAAARRLGHDVVKLDPGAERAAGPAIGIGAAVARARPAAVARARTRKHSPPDGWDEAIAILKRRSPQRLLSWPTLTRHAEEVRGLARMFGTILDRVGPRAVFMAGVDVQTFALCMAARQRDVRTVEVQHGLQGALHWSYAGWRVVPDEGWAVLPQTFWTWDEPSADAIQAWAAPCAAHDAFVGGNARLRGWLDANQGAAGLAEPPDELRVLVTLQPGFEDHPGISALAAEVAAEGGTMTFRLHPRMDQEVRRRIRRRRQSEGAVEDASDRSIFDALLHSTVHATVSSATVDEAACLGVGSVVLDPLGPSQFPEAHDHGLAATWDGVSPISRALEAVRRRVEVTAPPAVTDGVARVLQGSGERAEGAGAPPLVMAASVDLSEPSACSVHVLSLARELSRRGPVTLVARRPAGALVLDPGPDVSIRWLPLSPRLPNAVGFLLLAPVLLTIALRGARRFYVRAGTLSWTVSRALRLVRDVVLVQEHNGWLAEELPELGHSRLLARIAKFLQVRDAMAADGLRVVVPAHKRQFEDAGVDPRKVRVIGNGTNLSGVERLPRAEALRAAGLPPDRRYLGFLGNLVPWQGVGTALEALSELAKTHPDLDIIIAGDGPARHDLEALAGRLGVASRVHWLGWVQPGQVPAVLSCVDIAVAPFASGRNASPLKIRDYAAMGLPIVASGIPDLLAMEHEGVLLCHEPGSASALAGLLATLLGDRDRRIALASAARTHASSHWSWSSVANEVGQLIDSPAVPPSSAPDLGD